MAAGEHCDVHAEKIRQLETRQDKVDVLLDKIRNRLPHWATVVISLLTLSIGWLVSKAF